MVKRTFQTEATVQNITFDLEVEYSAEDGEICEVDIIAIWEAAEGEAIKMSVHKHELTQAAWQSLYGAAISDSMKHLKDSLEPEAL